MHIKVILLSFLLIVSAHQAAGATVTESTPVIRFAEKAVREAVSPYTVAVLLELMRSTGNLELTITSSVRTPADQARVMFQNIERQGVAHQLNLYGSIGDQVILAYKAAVECKSEPSEILAAMTKKIVEIGPGAVSAHMRDPKQINVIDIDPCSLTNRKRFADAVRKDQRVSKFLEPPFDPAFHLEIPQAVATSQLPECKTLRSNEKLPMVCSCCKNVLGLQRGNASLLVRCES